MLALVANQRGRARRAIRGGTEYLVAPLTMIVPGILKGSAGPLFYPPEEVAKDPSVWDGIPITVNHPEINGQFVSAQTPGIIDSVGIGFIESPKIASSGKLIAEGWFDIDAASRVDNRIVQRLEKGEAIELSTGLDADVEPAPEDAPYHAIARNYRGDHLAVLPDHAGACSLKDGCGVLVNRDYSGRAGGWTDLPTEYDSSPPFSSCDCVPVLVANMLIDNPMGEWEPPEAGEDAPEEIKRILKAAYSAYRDKHPKEDAATKTKGAKIAWGAVKKAGWKKDASGKWVKKKAPKNVETSVANDGWIDLTVANADMSFSEIRESLCEALSGRYPPYDSHGMSQPRPWIQDVYDGYFVYEVMGELYRLDYTLDDNGEVTLADEPVEVKRVVEYVPMNNAASGDQGVVMALNEQQRSSLVREIVANCDCWKNPGDDQILNGLPDEKLQQIRDDATKKSRAVTVANTAVHGFRDEAGNAYRINPETGKWEVKPGGQQQPAPRKAKQPVVSNADPDDDDDDGDDDAPARQVPKKGVANKDRTPSAPRRPRTLEEIVRELPPELQETVNNARKIEASEKAKVIEKLLVNVAPTDRQAHFEKLMKRPLEDLYDDLARMPKPPPPDETSRDQPAPRTRRQAANAGADDDMLVAPTMDWREINNSDNAGKRSTANGHAQDFADADDIADEDEYLANVPVSVKNRLQRLEALEQREKNVLIDQIVANFQGDADQEQRLVNRLRDKSVDELQDLALLSKKNEAPKLNYFGSSAAPIGNGGRQDAASDELLPLPVMNWSEEPEEETPRTRRR